MIPLVGQFTQTHLTRHVLQAARAEAKKAKAAAANAAKKARRQQRAAEADATGAA